MAKYIFQRASGYYLRYAIPRHYQHLLRAQDLRYSLYTASRRTAAKRALAVIGRVDILLEQLARGNLVLNGKAIRETVRDYILEAQDSISDIHLLSPPRDDDEAEAHIGILLDEMRRLEGSLASSTFSPAIRT